MEGLIPILFVIAIVSIFVLVFALSIISQRRRSETKKQQAASLGFSPVDAPDQGLLDRIINVHGFQSTRKIEIRNVSHQKREGADIYFVDVLDDDGEDTNFLAENAFIFVSPELNLPQFMLIPHIDAEGVFGELMDKVWTKITAYAFSTQGMVNVPLDLSPDFEDKYQLFGYDEFQVGELFTVPSLNWLSRTSNQYMLTGLEDTLMVSRFYPQRSKTEAKDLRMYYKDAVAIFRSFRDSS